MRGQKLSRSIACTVIYLCFGIGTAAYASPRSPEAGAQAPAKKTKASAKPSEFLPLTRSRLEGLRQYISFGEVYITRGEAGYQISLSLSGQGSIPQRQEPAVTEADAGEIVFSFHPRWREERLDDLSLRLCPDGSISAVFYDPDSSTVTAAYEGKLPRTEAARLMSRVKGAFEEADRPDPRGRDRQIAEGDLFYLSMRLKDGTSKEMGRKVSNVPEDVRGLIEDLSLLWRQLKKTMPADAYVVSEPIAEERFKELKRKEEFHFATVDELPADVRQVITDALSSTGRFHALSRAQFERLKSLTALITHNGSGYELGLFKSRNTDTPPKK